MKHDLTLNFQNVSGQDSQVCVDFGVIIEAVENMTQKTDHYRFQSSPDGFIMNANDSLEGHNV